jgi:hypothetical protein
MAENHKTPGKPETWPSVRRDDAVELIIGAEEEDAAGEDHRFEPEPDGPAPSPKPVRTRAGKRA